MGNSRGYLIALLLAVLVSGGCGRSDEHQSVEATVPNAGSEETIQLWQGLPPGAEALPQPETRVVNDEHWRSIIEVHNVSRPSLTVIRPAAGKANGAAMIVLPGGAFGILAWDAEGTEVGEFLAEHGVTAFILKYRVSDPTLWQKVKFLLNTDGLLELLGPKRDAAVDDAMQAVRVLRTNAATYGIDADRIGMMGFSAGAIATVTVLQCADESARPDIAALIYGMALEPEVPQETPPLLMVVAKDDPIMAGASTDIHKTWQAAGKPSELHILESGEHGFGMGKPDTDSMRFPQLLADWLRRQGYVESQQSKESDLKMETAQPASPQ